MRKILYIAITLVVCIFLKIQNLWMGFVPVFLLMSALKIDRNFLWEIPLALMLCDVLIVAFSDDIRIPIYILSVVGTALVSIVSPKKLFLIFPIIIFSVINENIYTASGLWATLWYGIHSIMVYFTTKQIDLQEFKL